MPGTSRRPKRRARRTTGRERAVAIMLRGLADHVEDGKATANVQIELSPSGEIWLVAANLRRDRVC